MTENKYQFGKIYKLTSEHTNKIYIGSTCQELLCSRLKQHNIQYKGWKKGKRGYLTSFELFELGIVQITLLENYPCDTNDKLLTRERYWIEQHRHIILNKYNPIRPDEEHKKIIKQYHKQRYENNKERITEYNKQYYEANKEKHKQYRETRKQKLNNKNV